MNSGKQMRACLATGLLALIGLALAPVRAAGVGRSHAIRFDRVSLEQGLSQGTINTVHQDHQGFMWFGTEDGLNRFDGYEFETFKHDPRDPSSLSKSFVWSIVEDEAGDLWIATDGGGLNRWNRATRKFTVFRNDPGDPRSLNHDRVRALEPAGDGRIWVGTEGGGLNLFDPAEGTFRRFVHDPGNPASISHDQIRAIHQCSDGTLWVGTRGGGLNRRDPGRDRFVHYRHDPENPATLSEDHIYTIHEDSEGYLWIGTYGRGLNRLDPRSGSVTRFLHDPDDPTSLGKGPVRTVYQDAEGTLWVGTESGLGEWIGEGTFAHHDHDPGDPRSLSDDKVTAVFQDRGEVLWVGTKSDGLNKWSPYSSSFGLQRRRADDPTSLSGDKVSAIQYDERRDAVWVGTFGAGLNRLDRSTGVFRHYRHEPSDPDTLADDRVMSLLLDREGFLWVGTYDGGLNRLDPSSSTFIRSRHDPADPRSLSRNSVMSLYEDREGTLWVGTYEGGLNRLDRSTGGFVRYRHQPSNPTSLSSDRVTSFHQDQDGALWIGTDGGGLNRYDPAAGTFTHYRHDPEDPRSLGSDVVFSIHEDAEGVLWIGTQENGLNRWDPADRRANRALFRRYTEHDGLPNNAVYGIMSDDEGQLWLSTNRGLSRFDAENGVFKNYDTSDGLQSNEFNFGAYDRSSEGEMFFGGIRGYNYFHPGEVRENPHAPPVLLTSFLKFNEVVELAQPISETRQIVLDYTDDVVSFEMAALDFAAPGKNRYAYKLEGFDEDWNQLGTTRRLTYTNLDAGEYTLRIKGSNDAGVWNESTLPLEIQVLPPPWQTWWAYSLYVMALLGVIFAYTRSQARKLEREAEYSRKLEQEVQARTQEIAVRNEELQLANQRLEAASLTDSLTGLKNRRYLMTEIDKAISFTARYYREIEEGVAHNRAPAEADFLFLMIDLDGLKGINDNYGHMAGDRTLLQMRDLLTRTCRKSDTVIRWGGDEFLVVGRNMNLKSCENLAERLRDAVASHPFDLGIGETVNLSCSIGFAQYPFIPTAPTHVTWEQVVSIADRALYLAKSSGRNAWVAIFGTENAPPRDLVRLINDETEHLAETGGIALRSSIRETRKIVWARGR